MSRLGCRVSVVVVVVDVVVVIRDEAGRKSSGGGGGVSICGLWFRRSHEPVRVNPPRQSDWGKARLVVQIECKSDASPKAANESKAGSQPKRRMTINGVDRCAARRKRSAEPCWAD